MRRRHNVYYSVQVWGTETPSNIWYSHKLKRWTVGCVAPAGNMVYPIWKFTKALQHAYNLLKLMEQNNIKGEVLITRFYYKHGVRWCQEFFYNVK